MEAGPQGLAPSVCGSRLAREESLPPRKGPFHVQTSRRLADDEPYFVIRAHDPLSSALVELHAYIGAGQSGAAHNKLAEIMAMTAARAPRPASSPKYRETFAISLAMEQWRDSHKE